jgi:hypothetical protein
MRRSLVFALGARNVNVLTAADASMISREDDEHLAADYCVLHQLWISQGRTHAGIIVRSLLAVEGPTAVGFQ